MGNRIHVVAAVIRDEQQNIFIAKRPLSTHQGGLWEFPGGKLEAGETPYQALQRELHEEIGIDVVNATPLIKISHDYPDKSVLLDVWEVTHFYGHAHGKEQQATRWVAESELRQYQFPAANSPIIRAALLPRDYAITYEPQESDEFYQYLENVFVQGIRLLQLRFKERLKRNIIDRAIQISKKHSAKLLINCDEELDSTFGCDGRHLSSKQLMSLSQRPFSSEYWLAASCHNEDEIKHAENIGVDFIVLAPVLETSSHPGAPGLGWQTFEDLCNKSTIPVFALGGMQKNLKEKAVACGAQGIAGISLYM